MASDYIKIGKIIDSQGIKGELKIYPLTNDIYRFDHLKTAFIGDNKLKVEVEKVRYYKDWAILKFKEFNNINQVLSFKGKFIYVDDEGKIDLTKGQYFIFDIIDCKVFDKKGKEIGIVTEVIQLTSNDIYIVKDIDKNIEHLIPAVKEFIIDIDIHNKKIVIDPIEGMIE